MRFWLCYIISITTRSGETLHVFHTINHTVHLVVAPISGSVMLPRPKELSSYEIFVFTTHDYQSLSQRQYLKKLKNAISLRGDRI